MSFPAAECEAGAAVAARLPRLPTRTALKGEERTRPLNAGPRQASTARATAGKAIAAEISWKGCLKRSARASV